MADAIGTVGDVLISGEAYSLVKSSMSGKFNAVRASDGMVLSIQPNGDKQHRDPGTDAAYERCVPDGNSLVYAYRGADGKHYVHVVAWRDASTVVFA